MRAAFFVLCLSSPVLPFILGVRVELNGTDLNDETVSAEDFLHCEICYHDNYEEQEETVGYLWGLVQGVGNVWSGFRNLFNEPGACMYHMSGTTESMWQNGLAASIGETWENGISDTFFYCNVMCVPTTDSQQCTGVALSEDLLEEAQIAAKDDGYEGGERDEIEEGLGTNEDNALIADHLDHRQDNVLDLDEILVVPERCASPDAADGESDSREMWAASSVNAPTTCQSEAQSRTCRNGAWSSWSGSYTDATCKVQARCASPDKANGESDSLVMFAAPLVNAPATCQSESQTRTCNDGVWSSWSGSYTHAACTVQARCSSPDKAHGEIDSRVMFEAPNVNAPAKCQTEPQSRSCNNGVWSSWSGSGSYTHAACIEQAGCASPDKAHGEADSRVMFASRSVNAPATCQSEAQTRTCSNGAWSIWTGSYTDASCSVQARCANADLAHAETDSREMFAAPSVNAPASCQSQLQSRTCNNGVLSCWSGSYTHAACTVQARCAGPDTAHGESESRKMFAASSVNAPLACQGETQSRTCSNGAWSSWSGSSTEETCIVQARCSSPDKASGESDSRAMFAEPSVNAPTACRSETQSRTCSNEAWSAWSGSFSNAACAVQARCSSPDKANGEPDSRVMFAASSVNAPQECESEKQNRACSNGIWSSWSGSYIAASCSVQARCTNPEKTHGESDSREMFASSSVVAPATCQSEPQTRSCSNGVWSTWSGSYKHATCIVEAPEPVKLQRCTVELCEAGSVVIYQPDKSEPTLGPDSSLSVLQKHWPTPRRDPPQAYIELWTQGIGGDPAAPQRVNVEDTWLVPEAADARVPEIRDMLVSLIAKCYGACKDAKTPGKRDFCCMALARKQKKQQFFSAVSAHCVAACTGGR